MAEKKKGFTLIELLVVISVIALLLAVLMPALNRAKELAKRVVCGSQLRQMGIAVSGYSGKFDGALPNIKDAAGKYEYHPFVAYRGDEPEHRINGKLIPYRLACLYDAHLIDNPKVFYCPSNRDPARMYKSYIDPPPWGMLPQKYNTEFDPQDQWVRAGYEWFPVDKDPVMTSAPVIVRGVKLPAPPRRLCTRYDKLSPSLAYCADVIRTRDWISHKYGKVCGLNLLYIDGRVVFCDDQNIFRLPTWELNPSQMNELEVRAIYYAHVLELRAQ